MKNTNENAFIQKILMGMHTLYEKYECEHIHYEKSDCELTQYGNY
jgi:hypothetical protein